MPGIAAIGLLASMLAACSPATTSSSSGGDSEVNIGLLASLSGAYAILGPATVAGADAAVAQLNAGGGLVIKGRHYKVKLDVKNDQSNSQVALSDEEALVRQDNVIAVVGPLADASLTVAPVTAQQKIINITASTGVKALLVGKPNYPLLFSTAPSLDYQSSAVVKGIQHWYPSVKRLAIVSDNNAATQSLYPLIQKYAKAAGMTVYTTIFPEGTTDISAIAAKVVAFKPDAVFAAPDDQTVVTIIQQLDSAGLAHSVPIFNLGGDETIVPSAQGHPVITQNISEADLSGADDSAAITQFVAAVKAQIHGNAKTVDEGLDYSDLYYPAILALGKAMVSAGTVTNTAAIAKAMATLAPVSALGGTVQWTSDHTFQYPILSILDETKPTKRQTALIQG